MTTDISSGVATTELDHETLDRDIAEWREWWGQLAEIGKPKMGEMASRLARFQERLARHFVAEEKDGCLSVVEGTDPRTVAKIEELRNEHRTFLADLDELVAQLQGSEPQIDSWGEAREAFEEFLDRLNCHEDAEEELSLQSH